MHGIALLQDLSVVLLVAGVVTVVFHRFRQPVVLGYILAGLIIGPHTPPFPLIHDKASIDTLAELGVIMLMFGLGLHFSLRKLASVGATAFVAATLEIALMGLLGYEVGRLFGWSAMDSLFLGAILSISSTTIIVKALQELKLTREKFADLIFGILIVEDILAIAILALLSTIAMTGTAGIGQITSTLGRLGIFLAVVLVVGLLVVPPLLRYVSRFKNNEVLVITALGLCFGVSLLAAKLGYSVALGAFLIGAIIAETRERGKIEQLIEPVRDVFSAIFFVAVGMLIDPMLLVEYAVPILVITVVVIVGKIIACSAGPFLTGHDTRTSLRVGMGVSQIGEFSFIIAQLGLTLNVTGKFLYPIAVMVSAITTLTTPYLIRSSDPLVDRFDRLAPLHLVETLSGYTSWVKRMAGSRGGSSQVRRLLRRWLLQIGLNMALVTGFLLAAAGVGDWADRWMPQQVSQWIGGPKAAVWLVALLLSLPLLIASFRKLRAMAMLAAEANVTHAAAGEQTAVLRSMLVHAILIAGTAAMIGWVLVLSSTLLPPGPGAFALAAIIFGVAVVLWRSLIKVYAKAQISLTETMTREETDEQDGHAEVAPLSTMLEGAALDSLTIPTGSPISGKLIREVELRSRTGASIVGIQRPKANIVNPGPDEELRAGDRVLLLGDRKQLDAAHLLFVMSA
ncbi:MAG: cation:proton antiporter [Planctomycetes bacterium]|nr:cation:proton antiporter [Planctomycetota bacterium]